MRQKDDTAAEMLPVRLMISIAMIAAVLLLLVGASGTLRIFLAEQQVERQCLLLQSTLATMVANGVFRDVDDCSAIEGTKRVHTLILPDSLIYLSFGSDPDLLYTEGYTSELVEDQPVIFYQVQGGSKKVLWLPNKTYKFREGTFVDGRWVINGTSKSYIIQGGGTTTLAFECVQKNHIPYILIHRIDGFLK